MSINNLLACDVGLKRIGLAISLQGVILPIPPILRKNRNQASNALSLVLQEREIQTLIVGIPKDNHEMERRIRHFISLVEFKEEIIYINEDLSSRIAEESLLDLGKKERRQKLKNGELDSLSAMEILKRYKN